MAKLFMATPSTLTFKIRFGIGPGCTGLGGETAVPPVRIREVVEAFSVDSKDNLHSICNSDYEASLVSIAENIGEQEKPLCYPGCSTHGDDEPQCSVKSIASGGETGEIPECLRDGNGAYLTDSESGEFVIPQDSDDACYVTLTDSSEMSSVCVDRGHNLEFKIVERESAEFDQITVTCEVYTQPKIFLSSTCESLNCRG